MNPTPTPSMPTPSSLRTWSLWSIPATILVTLLLVLGLPDSWATTIQNMTGWVIVAVSHFCGLSADYDSITHEYQVSGFRMRLIFECTAFTYLQILTLLILCTPKRPWQNKVHGILFCGLTLLSVNLIRLIGLGLIGTYALKWFEFIHDYVWKIGTVILVVGLWILWFERGAVIERWLTWCASTLGTSLGATALMNLIRPELLNMLTFTADKFFILVNPDFVWSQKLYLFKSFNHLVIRTAESQVAIHFPWNEYTFNYWGDVLSLALFAGLVAGVSINCMIAKQKIYLRRLLVGVAAGTLLLLTVQTISLVTMALLVMHYPSMDHGKTFLWAESLLVSILPVIMTWWIARKGRLKTAT